MKKKIIKIFIIVVCLIATLALTALALSAILDILRTPDDIPEVSSEDIFADEAYLKLDRNVVYEEYGDSEPLTHENIDDFGEAARFFYNYFDCIINGDYKQYSSFFTEQYLKSNKLPAFTMQKLYDISVSLYGITADGEKTDIYTVSFKIKDNNNTFCDVKSNVSKTFVYKLVYVDGHPRINEILDRKVAYD